MSDHWGDGENELVVRGYFELVADEMQGRKTSKVETYRRIAQATGRGAKAVEFKFLNVSGVLASLGLGHVRGLRPYGNFQSSMVPIVENELDRHPQIRDHLAGTRAGCGDEPKTRADLRFEVPAQAALGRSRDVSSRGIHDAAVGKDGTMELEVMQVTDLWNFATGGADVAAMPGQAVRVPRGPRPAGVEEALGWMREALSDGYVGDRRFLFFVGGPGGGKSYAAASLVEDLEQLSDTSDGLAHRSYTYDSPGGEVLLVNDATIPPDAADSWTLAEDLSQTTTRHVIGCVNRGVLVDDAQREPSDGPGPLITAWLRNGRLPESDQWCLESRDHLEEATPYLRQALLHGETGRVEVLAVFVDVCSLLEKRPEVRLEGSRLRGAPYEILTYAPHVAREETPAGKLLQVVLERLRWEPRGPLDPIAANLESLSHASARSGLLSLLRAAELGSSQRFAYRQIWGSIARAIAGPLPEQINESQLIKWLDEEIPVIGSEATKAFEGMRSLARVRLHEALFGDDWSSSSRHPILGATARVDPSRDLRPGEPGDSQSSGWATPVSEAFSGAELGASPLVGLRSSANSAKLEAYWTEFDEALDSAFVEAVWQSDNARWRSEATAWYGRYLTRMLAVSHGYPAFEEQLREWTFAWEMSPNLQKNLKEKLESLLRPSRWGGKSESQVPLFGSRTEAVFGSLTGPTLVVELGNLDLKTSKEGERLVLKVERGHTELGEVLLDLDLVREALASEDGWLGLTDATESVAPRLERFRSLNLVPAKMDHNAIRVITREDTYSISAVPSAEEWR